MVLHPHARASRPRFWSVILKAGVLILLMGGTVEMASAQKMKQIGSPIPYDQVNPDWHDCGLRKIDVDAFVSHRRPLPRRKVRSATIEVDYGFGFSPEARRAFERAVSVWETHIESDVPIQIDASFEDLSENVLGGAGPSFFYGVDTSGDDNLDTFVSDALIDAVTGEDQQSTSDEPDINARFNRSRDDWHFGNGDAPAGTIDFTSVVLHEIGHGLHYIGATNVDGAGDGRYGIDFQTNDGTAATDVPSIFTRLLAEQASDGSLASLTNESVFPNPSAELGDALTGGQLFYDGGGATSLAAASTGPVPPKVYAPSQFSEGSSTFHLDEATYPSEAPNALMTPRIARAETNRLPGPVLCGQLFDMGWPMGEGCLDTFPDVYALQVEGSTSTNQNQITLTWAVKDDADVEEYVVERQYFGNDVVERVRVQPAEAPPVTLTELGLGAHSFRVRWVRSDNTDQVTGQEVKRTVNPQNGQADVRGRDDRGLGTVHVSWDVPAGSGDFDYRIERRRGQAGDFQTVAVREVPEYTAEDQLPGRYEYRVRSVDDEGNEVVSDAESVEIGFEGDVFVQGPFPNPAQNQAVFLLTANDAQPATIEVYNVIGERIYVDERRELQAEAPTRLTFNTRQWGSGMYFLRVTGEAFTTTRKMVVVH